MPNDGAGTVDLNALQAAVEPAIEARLAKLFAAHPGLRRHRYDLSGALAHVAGVAGQAGWNLAHAERDRELAYAALAPASVSTSTP